MKTVIRPVVDTDWDPIVGIFNHFVVESFAAYLAEPVDPSFLRDRQEANPTFPFVVAENENGVVGFAFISPFHSASSMRHTATLTYFLHPETTGQGIGTALLAHLLESGRHLGITNFLAHISSLNSGSIRFHLKHGFIECGRFINVGIKKGTPFDMVWMQKQQS